MWQAARICEASDILEGKRHAPLPAAWRSQVTTRTRMGPLRLRRESR